MSLSPEETKRIQEEELLRFKTRKTLEICQKYMARDSQVTYREPEAALYIRMFALVPVCVYLFDTPLSKLLLRGHLVPLAAFCVGFYACDLLDKRKRAERAIWGLPVNVASHLEAALDQLGALALLVAIPSLLIQYYRRPDNEVSFLSFVLCAAVLVVLGALLYNTRWLKDRKAAAIPRPLEDVFAEALKRQEAARTAADLPVEKAETGTSRLRSPES